MTADPHTPTPRSTDNRATDPGATDSGVTGSGATGSIEPAAPAGDGSIGDELAGPGLDGDPQDGASPAGGANGLSWRPPPPAQTGLNWRQRLGRWWAEFSLQTKLLAVATLVVSLMMTGITFFALN
ncbi:MAG: hypothetical protein WBM08_03220, partial [Prochlorococcaceae cyanobacterium]